LWRLAARLERATRDVVSRACYLEAREGRGSPSGGVWLDLSHLNAEEIEKLTPEEAQALVHEYWSQPQQK